MELKATRFEVADRVATVWLHRPHRHNAWTGRMHAEYRWILASWRPTRGPGGGRHRQPASLLRRWRPRRAAGHAERGGYDPGLPDDPAQPGYGVRPEWDHDLAWHHALRLPVIAAVNGACAGVGLALALFCDLRYVSATAKLTTAAPRLGPAGRVRVELHPPPPVRVTRRPTCS